MGSAPATASRLPLVERSGELELLAETLERVRDGGAGELLFVAGEAGVGKTSLLRAFADEGGATQVLWGACDPLFTPRPLGPLLAPAERAGGALEELLRDGALPHEVAAELARELARRRASVFVLDDVHWADEATLDVLRLLARRIERVAAVVIASYRDDELASNHPLRRVLGELATSPSVRRLRLAPLSPAGVAELAAGSPFDPEELYRRTGGNPFFVVEALAAGEETIPVTVRDAVLARAARLSPEAHALLGAAAVVPQRVELWLLEELTRAPLAPVDECVAAGMLVADASGVAFRHELARLAVEESLPPQRRLNFHRRALAALTAPLDGVLDFARLAHHADAAGDAGAVLRFALAAGDRAAALGAHREAAAHYAHALRFGDRLPAGVRADVLERRSRSCYVTDQNDEAIDALEEAMRCRRDLGDQVGEAEGLRQLSWILWCPGRAAESDRVAREAVALLEPHPPGAALARAYVNLGEICCLRLHVEEGIGWASRGLALAERVGETETVVRALLCVGGWTGDAAKQRAGLELARREGFDDYVGRVAIGQAASALDEQRYEDADNVLTEGVAFCGERGLERNRLYLLDLLARLELVRDRWTEAAEAAALVLRTPKPSVTPRIGALSTLGRLRARRGDPGASALLDEALALAEPTGTLLNLGPVALARAEAALLAGDPERLAAETQPVFDEAVERRVAPVAGALAVWRRRAGVDEPTPPWVPAPFSLELAGDRERAAGAWARLGCRYEAALTLAWANDDVLLLRALEDLQGLGAAAAARLVARRLRERGVRGLPRGPRPATRDNPAGLTGRELEVLRLLADGHTNPTIAERLYLSPRTVDRHVSSLLGKLDARTRGQAVAAARRLGLVEDR
ncbi:MAG TPA: AAA family ATPase [Gaiellaceae bacterium]|nr:AAA family ATPase [Gaiellaceae bacterium]